MTIHVQYEIDGRQVHKAAHPCRAVQNCKPDSVPEYSGKLSEIDCRLCRSWIQSRPSMWNRLRLADLEAGTAGDLKVMAEEARRAHLKKLERAKELKREREIRAEQRRAARLAAMRGG